MIRRLLDLSAIRSFPYSLRALRPGLDEPETPEHFIAAGIGVERVKVGTERDLERKSGDVLIQACLKAAVDVVHLAEGHVDGQECVGRDVFAPAPVLQLVSQNESIRFS